MSMSEILIVSEVVCLLNTARKMIQNGELPAVKVGREWRVTMETLAEFMGAR